jgi:hypothetical protein
MILHILWLPSRRSLAEATEASLGLTLRHASGCCCADSSSRGPPRLTGRSGDRESCEREIGASRCRHQDVGTSSSRELLLAPEEEIFSDSVLRIRKCVLAPRRAPDLPISLLILGRDEAAARVGRRAAQRGGRTGWPGSAPAASAIRAAAWQHQLAISDRRAGFGGAVCGAKPSTPRASPGRRRRRTAEAPRSRSGARFWRGQARCARARRVRWRR